jgi:hypothetical protein
MVSPVLLVAAIAAVLFARCFQEGQDRLAKRSHVRLL